MANLVSAMVPTLHLPTSPATHSRRRRWLGTRAYWLCQLAGWGGLFLVWLIPLPFRATAIRYDVLYGLLLCVSGAALTHLLRLVFLDQLRTTRTWPALFLRLLPWIIGASMAHAGPLLWFIALLPANESVSEFHPFPENETFVYLDTLTLAAPIFTIWTGFYLGLRYYRQHQAAQLDRLRLDAAVKDSELRALKAQLNPHFLFNSLNTLRALIPRDLTQPREAITLLSELLRASLACGHEETIPLARELETVDNYLALEKLRFEQRVHIRREIDAAALPWRVPPFLVQTLVENAVKYGIATREAGGEITLSARIESGGLRLRITNPGRIAPAGDSTGLGLKNSRARLALLFGPAAALTLTQAAADLVLAEAVIPAVTTAAAAAHAP